MADQEKEKGYSWVDGAMPLIGSLPENWADEEDISQREKDNQELRDVINNKK